MRKLVCIKRGYVCYSHQWNSRTLLSGTKTRSLLRLHINYTTQLYGLSPSSYLYDGVGVVETGTDEHRRGVCVVRVCGPPGKRAQLHIGYGGGIVVDGSVLLSGAVLSAHVAVLGLGDLTSRRFDEPPEQLPVEVFAERAADQVEGDGVDARVAVAQAEAGDTQHVPEYVVLVLGPGV